MPITLINGDKDEPLLYRISVDKIHHLLENMLLL